MTFDPFALIEASIIAALVLAALIVLFTGAGPRL
jgi:hypothetical protein